MLLAVIFRTRKVVTNLLKKVTPSEKQTTDTKQKETKLKYRSSFKNVLNLFKKHKIDHADYTSPYEGTNTCTVNPPALNLHQRMENLFVTCKEGSSDKYAKNEKDAMSDICSNGEIDQCNIATTDINAGSTSEDVEINIVDDSVHECVVGFFDKLFDSNSSCD